MSIPKTIHWCWLSDDDYPELVKLCIASWEKYLPDYKIVLWDKKKFDIESVAWVKQAYENRKYAFAADYIRLYALSTEGGIYLDSDVEVYKSFNDLLEFKSFLGYETSGDIEAAVIGAEKNTDWVTKSLEYYKGKNFIENAKPNLRPLPLIVGEALSKFLNIEIDGVEKDLEEIHIFPSSTFSPKNMHTKVIKRENSSYCVHHFDGNWAKGESAVETKVWIHKVIYKVLGVKGHNRLVSFIRKLK